MWTIKWYHIIKQDKICFLVRTIKLINIRKPSEKQRLLDQYWYHISDIVSCSGNTEPQYIVFLESHSAEALTILLMDWSQLQHKHQRYKHFISSYQIKNWILVLVCISHNICKIMTKVPRISKVQAILLQRLYLSSCVTGRLVIIELFVLWWFPVTNCIFMIGNVHTKSLLCRFLHFTL